MSWAVKVTEEYAAWFIALITQGRQDPPPEGTPAGLAGPVGDQDHLRVRPRSLSALTAGRRQGRELGTLVPGQHPQAEHLYFEYTTDDEE